MLERRGVVPDAEGSTSKTMDIGAQLQSAREGKGLSIGTVAERTRVPVKMLAAIERNDQSALPPHPFGRGFVRAYAEEVDLDSHRLVREYFAQFPSPLPVSNHVPLSREPVEPSWQPPSRWVGMATAVAGLVVVVAAAVVRGRRGEGAADPETVGTTGTSPATPGTGVSPPVTPTAAEPSGAANAPAIAQPSAPALTVVLSLTRACWVAATADGERVIYRILQPGERHTLTAARELTLRFGDAGGVTWTINGRDAGTPGANGAVRNARITPDNAGTFR
jgi:cytoskeletal protein RodZ